MGEASQPVGMQAGVNIYGGEYITKLDPIIC